MWITEYNEERDHAQSRQEGYEEGREEGIEEGEERGLIRGIAKLVKNGVVTLSQAAEQLETTEAEFLEKAAEFGICLR